MLIFARRLIGRKSHDSVEMESTKNTASGWSQSATRHFKCGMKNDVCGGAVDEV